LSVTITVNDDVAAVVGVPEITPVADPSDNPAGKLPELMLHKYGGVPPVAARIAEYAAPTAPFGSEVVVIAREATTVMLRFAVVVRLPLSVTFIVKLDDPTVVAVPEITPVLAASESPGGKLPELMLHE
jgi:hypothetical protein